MKRTFDIELVRKALHEAAWKAHHGTRDERAGKFLGKQAAVENAAAVIRQKISVRR